MTDRTFQLRVVSPEEVLFEVEVSSVRFPGADGSFGVLPRHAPMVALTESGLLTAKKADGGTLEYIIHDGFAEVRDNRLTVLTRSAEKPDEIDMVRAERAAERARGRLRLTQNEIDLARARAALRRALMRTRYSRRS